MDSRAAADDLRENRGTPFVHTNRGIQSLIPGQPLSTVGFRAMPCHVVSRAVGAGMLFGILVPYLVSSCCLRFVL